MTRKQPFERAPVAKLVMPGLVPGIQCVREDALSAG
jgi:hypothetical protein